MIRDPLVTVVMPARDAAATISSAIKSIVDQSFPDWELLVIDDGSVDKTAAIVAELESQDARIRLVPGDGAGEPSARNMGIAAARGEWIAMMDADDVAREHRLERQLSFLQKHPELFAAASQATLFVEYGNPLGRSSVSSPITTAELEQMKERCQLLVLCHPTFILNAEKLRALGGYDPGFKQACDAELINRAVYLHDQDVLVQPEQLIWYRIAAQGMSTRGLALQRNVLRYLEYRNKTWVIGGNPKDLPAFLASDGNARPLRRWRHDRGALLYREAGILVGKRQWVGALPRLVIGLVLHPRYVLMKLRAQEVFRRVPQKRRR
jgi:glycosyltransferase involved in cell wall biosynthesis